MAVATGTYKQNNEKLLINTEINGFTGMMIPLYIFTIVFYLLFIGTFFMADNIEGNGVGSALLIFFINAAFMFGFPYFMMRGSIKRMKHELELDFYYLTQK